MPPHKRTLEDEEQAFPRGGADQLTPYERRRIEVAAKAELDREAAEEPGSSQAKQAAAGKAAAGTKGRKRAKKGELTKGVEEEDHFLGDAARQQKGYVELLKAKRLGPGMRVWGMVLEVADRGLAISLPHGLRGWVNPKEASDVLAAQLKQQQQQPPPSQKQQKQGQELEQQKGQGQLEGAAASPSALTPSLTQLFHVGQFVRCVVTSPPTPSPAAEAAAAAGGGRAAKESATPVSHAAAKLVPLSLRLRKLCSGLDPATCAPGVALPAVVKAVEDHGFVLGLGIKGVSAFLRRNDHEAAYGEGAAPLVGALLEVVVKTAPDSRGVASVTSDPTQVASALAREDAGALSLDALLPGSLVTARVVSCLRDGLMLRFLQFFTGSVDPFHLGPGLPSTKSFAVDQKVKARVIYIDPVAKQVGLSLLPHLINLTLPTATPMLGQVFDTARVLRVDGGLGALLQLPLGGELGGSCPAYCHVSNLSDSHVTRAEQVAKPGGSLRVRVIGFRLLDGLATVTAKQSVVDQQVLSLRDVLPGMPLTATILTLDEDGPGLMVSVAERVKALVPWVHATELGTPASARKKFKVGQQVPGRVWSVDPERHRLALTLKPGLLTSKLPLITSPAAAAVGAKAHGMVTGIKAYGVFVTFYGGVSGMAHLTQLGLTNPADKPEALFRVGQVVRARILAVEPGSGRLRLSLVPGKADTRLTSASATDATTTEVADSTPATGAAGNTDACGGLQPGQLVEGVVVGTVEAPGSTAPDGSLLPARSWVQIQLAVPGEEGRGGAKRAKKSGGAGGLGQGSVMGRLELAAHLSDHPEGAAALLGLWAQPGVKTGPLVVLERLEGQRTVLLSRKQSLVAAAQAGRLITSFDQVVKSALLSGYVANVTGDAVFVRFGGHVTGRAGLSQLADSFTSDPRRLFSVGQSVRARVASVDTDKSRFSLTLRPSLLGQPDASYLAALLHDMELASSLKAAAAPPASAEQGVDWEQDLAVGACCQAALHQVASYGLIMDILGAEDLVGVIRPHHQARGPVPAPGTPLTCRVLDVSKLDGIIDLSAAPRLLTPSTPDAPTLSASKASAGEGGQPEQLPDNKKGKGAKQEQSQQAAGQKEKSRKNGKGKAGVDKAVVLAEAEDGRLQGPSEGKQQQQQQQQQQQLRVGQVVEAMVELLKEERGHFAVLSLLPSENRGKGAVGAGGLPALVFAATTDFNTAVPEAVSRRLAVGQHLLVTIQKLASADTGHRVLATIDLTRASDPAPPNNPAQGRRSVSQRISPGQMVSVSVTALHPTYVEVAVGGRRNLTGVVHMSEVRDLPPLDKLAAVLGTDAPPLAAPDKATAVKAEKKSGRKRKAAEAEAAVQQQPAAAGETAGDTGLPGWSGEGPLNPLAAFTVGQQLQAVVLPPAASGGLSASNRQGYMNLSIRPSVIAAAQAAVTSAASAAVGPGAEAGTTQAPSHTPETAAGGALPPANGELSLTTPLNPAKLSLGSLVCGVVSEVEDDHVWVSLSPYVKARLMLLDTSPNPDLLPQPMDADANDAAGAGVQSPASPAGAKVPVKGGAFMVGQPLAAWVLKIQANKHAMDLTRLPGSVSAALAAVAAAAKVEKTRDSEGLQLLAAAHAAARAKKAEKTRDKGLAEAEAEASQVGVKPVASPAKEAEPLSEAEQALTQGCVFISSTCLHAALRTATGNTLPAGSVALKPPSPAALAAGWTELLHLLQPGRLIMGRVASARRGTGVVSVHLAGKLFGRVALTDIHDEWVEDALEGVREGMAVRCAVLSVDAGSQLAPSSTTASKVLPKVALSLRPSRGGMLPGSAARLVSVIHGGREPAAELLPRSKADGDGTALGAITLSRGTLVRGYVKRCVTDKGGVFVVLDRHTDGRIKLSNLSDGFIEVPETSFPEGRLVTARVAAVSPEGRVELSLRSSVLPSGRGVSELQPGELVDGRVRRVEKYGVFVDILGTQVAGLAHISELSDAKVHDVSSLFMVRQAVRARILAVDPDSGKVALSLKPSVVNATAEGNEGASGAPRLNKRARKAAAAAAAKAAAGGAAVDVEMSKEEDEQEEEEGGEEDHRGQLVAVDDIEESDSDMGSDADNDPDEDEDEDDEAGDAEESDEESEADDSEGSGSSSQEVSADSEDGDDVDDDNDDDDEEEEEEEEEDDTVAGGVVPLRQKLLQAVAAPLGGVQPAVAGPAWGGLLLEEDQEQQAVAQQGVAGDPEGGQKRSKGAKKRAAAERERLIREAEVSRLQGEGAPQSVAEFERAVLASPNSSYTWIRYMAWQLGLGDADKARAIAQRALDTINYREEGEKFNIWVAWLNLEANAGQPTPAEAVMARFNKALPYCDAKKLYMTLLGILAKNGWTELLASTLKVMCKKFNGSAKVWTRAIEDALTHSGATGGEAARQMLERALKALPRRKHVKVIVAAALLEFRLGSPERGRSIMEGVLRNYPKRLDLWSVYLDQEVKLGDAERTRAVFERATSMTVPARKMKFLFKRWLDWEKSSGAGSAAVEHVKQKAMEFVERSAKA